MNNDPAISRQHSPQRRERAVNITKIRYLRDSFEFLRRHFFVLLDEVLMGVAVVAAGDGDFGGPVVEDFHRDRVLVEIAPAVWSVEGEGRAV